MRYYVFLTSGDPADPDLPCVRVAAAAGLVPYSAPVERWQTFDLAGAVARLHALAAEHAGPLFREVSLVRV